MDFPLRDSSEYMFGDRGNIPCDDERSVKERDVAVIENWLLRGDFNDHVTHVDENFGGNDLEGTREYVELQNVGDLLSNTIRSEGIDNYLIDSPKVEFEGLIDSNISQLNDITLDTNASLVSPNNANNLIVEPNISEKPIVLNPQDNQVESAAPILLNLQPMPLQLSSSPMDVVGHEIEPPTGFVINQNDFSGLEHNTQSSRSQNKKPSKGRRRTRDHKKKMYEIETPFEDKDRESKRQNAIKAHRNRQKKCNSMKKLMDENDKLRGDILERDRRIRELTDTIVKYDQNNSLNASRFMQVKKLMHEISL